MSKRKLILANGVLVVAVLAAVASTDDNEATRVDDDSDEDGSDGDSGESDTFVVGDVVELGDWHVQVHGMTDPFESTNELVEPGPGNRWVSVDVEVTNNGDMPETVSSLLCFEITDSRNQSYSQALTAELGQQSPDGEVAVDGSRRGTIEYEMPVAAEGLQLNFKCDLLSTGTATIALDG